MLKALELESTDGLFAHLPERLRLERVDLPEPLSEVELVQYFRELGRLNSRIPPSHSFLGAGASRRFSPAIVNQVISRPDFYTTYTPYQAEASQGTLQATYEFQTMITLLTGLDVANASLYDGATSLAEATAMAVAHTNRQNVVVAGALHPEYAQVLQTYSEAQHYEILRVATGADGRVDPAKLEQAVTPTTAAVILQQPNFYGVLEDAQPISDLAHRSGALLIPASILFRLDCWRPQGTMAPTSRSAMDSRWACRCRLAVHTSASSPARSRCCGGCPVGWSVAPWMHKVGVATS